MPFMFRVYKQNGNVDTTRTLENINDYYLPRSGNNLTVLPRDCLNF